MVHAGRNVGWCELVCRDGRHPTSELVWLGTHTTGEDGASDEDTVEAEGKRTNHLHMPTTSESAGQRDTTSRRTKICADDSSPNAHRFSDERLYNHVRQKHAGELTFC